MCCFKLPKYRELWVTKAVLSIELMIDKGYLLFVLYHSTEKRIECEQNSLCWSPVEQFMLYNAKNLGGFCRSNKNCECLFVASCSFFLFLDDIFI